MMQVRWFGGRVGRLTREKIARGPEALNAGSSQISCGRRSVPGAIRVV